MSRVIIPFEVGGNRGTKDKGLAKAAPVFQCGQPGFQRQISECVDCLSTVARVDGLTAQRNSEAWRRYSTRPVSVPSKCAQDGDHRDGGFTLATGPRLKPHSWGTGLIPGLGLPL